MYPWNVSANFLVLRLISFNLDSIWSTRKIEKEMVPAQSLQNRDTIPEDITTISHSVEDYSLLTCLAYVLYPPLYIAGPIISFNAYYHYTKSRQQTESKLSIYFLSMTHCFPVDVFIYAVRWCVAFFLLEIATSFFPFFAIVKSGDKSID
jgi:protein-cysteine N-palmitoyltransferase HHAT